MASSNRHWPSMFKSKPCTHHQWQHDINSSIIPSCHRSPYSSAGCEERSPEPKPRWNPKPEQIRILETIFNSGMVNPPREEIRKIRAQLQEYGQVGDANVFYWFQNRKSRSKHKNRYLQNNSKTLNQTNPNSTTVTTTVTAAVPVQITAASSSSSSSEKTSPKLFSAGSANVVELLNSPTASVNQQQNYLNASGEFFSEAFFFPVQNQNQVSGGGVFGFPELENAGQVSGGVDLTVGNNSGLLLTELMMMNDNTKKCNNENLKMNNSLVNHNYSLNSAVVSPPTSLDIPSTVSTIGGLGEHGLFTPTRSTVFINDVAFEVAVGPFNVREAFGEDAVLIHSSGQTVVTNEWGITLQSLQHGAFYYLVRTLTTSHGYTFDLI